MAFDRLLIAGFGLIGASVALAARRARPAVRVDAVDLDERVNGLRALGIADRVEPVSRISDLAAEADLIVLSAPAQHIASLVEALVGSVAPGALVIDTAGTKSTICAHAAKILGAKLFIGAHPMAGSEKSGGFAADPMIFRAKPFVLCPLPGVDAQKLLDLVGFVESLGARPVTLDPTEHDRLVAMISHLPQLLSTTLMRTVFTAVNDRDLAMKVAGNGFRDMTRLAASDYEAWEGVLATNGADIERALDEFERTLADIRGRLADGTLDEAWREVAAVRRRMLDRTFQPVSRPLPSHPKKSDTD